MSKTAVSGFVIAALVLACLGSFTDIDMTLARSMYINGSFPARHAWWAETFGHDYMRRLLVVAGAGVIGLALIDWVRPFNWLQPWIRQRVRVVAWSAALVPLVVSLAKHFAFSHCPWDVVEFGGGHTYVRLLQAVPANALPGHCMPAGHASSALWLVSTAVFWLPHKPRAAFAAAFSMLTVGFALGWIQQLRGAHFLTHTLWSVWISCATVGLICALGMRGNA
jgi:membrane-associated PAP2 superfamily phosphatase